MLRYARSARASPSDSLAGCNRCHALGLSAPRAPRACPGRGVCCIGEGLGWGWCVRYSRKRARSCFDLNITEPTRRHRPRRRTIQYSRHLRDRRHSIHAVIAGLDPANRGPSPKSLQSMTNSRGWVTHARASHPRTADPAGCSAPARGGFHAESESVVTRVFTLKQNYGHYVRVALRKSRRVTA
jgi:hypothetical protein